MHANDVTGSIVDAAIAVHSAVGPGLLESAYQACLAHELCIRGHRVQLNVPVPLVYKGLRLDCAYKVDLIVDACVIVELKAQSKLLPIHDAQLLSYLRLSNIAVGLLLNFHQQHMKDGIKRMVHRLAEAAHMVQGF